MRSSRKDISIVLSPGALVWFILIPGFCILASLSGFPQKKSIAAVSDSDYWNLYQRIDKPQQLNLKKFCSRDKNGSIDLFIKCCTSHFPQFAVDSLGSYDIKALRKCLYLSDLDGDGQPDIIFSGPGEGSSMLTQIYINRKDSFELVFEDYQYITSMVIRNGHLSELTLCDPGVEDSWLYFSRYYRVELQNGQLVFIHGKQTAEFRYAEKPELFNFEGNQVISAVDSLIIRASASVIDKPLIRKFGMNGNQIASYVMKFRMIIVGRNDLKSKDPWCYIEIIPDLKPARSLFYDTGDYPTFIRGWVKLKDIKTTP